MSDSRLLSAVPWANAGNRGGSCVAAGLTCRTLRSMTTEGARHVAYADLVGGLLDARVDPATEHLAQQVVGEHRPRPAHQIEGQHRTATHRVDVGECVGSRDATEVVGVVDDGCEEVGRADDRAGRAWLGA